MRCIVGFVEQNIFVTVLSPLGSDRLLRLRGRVEVWRGVQFSKRLEFGRSILKMHKL